MSILFWSHIQQNSGSTPGSLLVEVSPRSTLRTIFSANNCSQSLNLIELISWPEEYFCEFKVSNRMVTAYLYVLK